jgi:hypothetical protein
MTKEGGVTMDLAMPAETEATPKPMTLRQRARIAIGDFRVGHVIVIDDEAGSIEDTAGNRFDVSRDIVPKTVFDSLKVGSKVHFRENAFRSIAELKL